MNIEILICTPDIRSERFKRCLDSLKSTARGIRYNLTVRDNGGDTHFNHAREINKSLATTDGYFVTIDDDVELVGDWLTAMLDAVTIDTGIVATTEFKTPSMLWRRGWYCDSEAKPLKWCGDIFEPTCVPAVSSCCMLITPETRKGNLFLLPDTGYEKYYFDPDLCLQCWQHGLSVKVIPQRCIHYGQGAIVESGVDVGGVLQRDRQRFKARWIDSGVLECLKRDNGYLWPEDMQW